jgi:lysophospholipase L1-like esterase
MNNKKLMRKALEIGQSKAAEVLRFRKEALKIRKLAFRKKGVRVHPIRGFAPTSVFRKKKLIPAADSAGVLVAEGDSWFDYPWTDILRVLEDYYGYDVESVAHKGDRVEEMAYAGGQLEELSRLIEKLIRRNIIPKAILLSGGGNDIAGDEFAMLLNHASSAIAGLNEDVVNGVIDQRIRTAYVTILSAITSISKERLKKPLPILVHGYDYAVPDGRGFMGGWGFLPGPWLEPGFREKGFHRLTECKELTKKLIDRFNKMLKEVCSLQEFGHVKFVDLRRTLSSGPKYKKFWANELHPTHDGFRLVTDRFAKKINSLH